MRMLALAAALVCAGPLSAQQYDLLISGATVLDGTGAPGRQASVAVAGGRIVLVAPVIAQSEARRVIDASGLVVAPGFIDAHAHIESIIDWPGAESHIRQGITTAVGGADGGGQYPLAAYLTRVARARPAINVAYLVGHNTIRAQAMGRGQRAPTAAELARMRAMVTQAMRDGAFGLSTGLEYVPGTYATTGEIVELARAAAARGGIYTSHVRDEAAGVFASVRETIEIGRQAGIPVVITHHKVIGQPQWGLSERTLAMVDAARQDGVDIMLDQYPYTATATGLSILIPSWALAGRPSDFARRAATPGLRDSIVAGIVHAIRVERGFEDLRFVQFNSVPWQPALQGRTLHDWAVERELPTTPEMGAELIIEAQLLGGARVVYHVVDERDVQRIMRHPMTMIASDGALARPGSGHPHPRSYGTFPRVLGRYVREERVLTLEEAVHKMTGLPAARLGLEDRGRIAEGARADLVIFDPNTVGSPATFEAPHQYPTGIPFVIVNGQVAVEQGSMTAVRAGMVLRHR